MDTFPPSPPQNARRAGLPPRPTVDHCVNSLAHGLVDFDRLNISASSPLLKVVTTEVLERRSRTSLLSTSIRRHLEVDTQTLDGSSQSHSQSQSQGSASQESQERAPPGTLSDLINLEEFVSRCVAERRILYLPYPQSSQMAQEYMNNSDTVGPIPEEWNDCNVRPLVLIRPEMRLRGWINPLAPAALQSVTDSICFYPLSDDSPEHSPVHEVCLSPSFVNS